MTVSYPEALFVYFQTVKDRTNIELSEIIYKAQTRTDTRNNSSDIKILRYAHFLGHNSVLRRFC